MVLDVNGDGENVVVEGDAEITDGETTREDESTNRADERRETEKISLDRDGGDGDDGDEDDEGSVDVIAPETPGDRERALGRSERTRSASTPTTPSRTEAKKKRVDDGEGDDEAFGGSSLRDKFDATSASIDDRASALGDIFDLPGNGLLSLDELSRGGHAMGNLSPDDLAYGRAGDAAATPTGVSIRGVLISDPHVNHRLLEIAAMKLMPDNNDAAWRLSSERVKRRTERRSNAFPRSYPTRAPPGLDSPLLFKRLDADALFFTFYFCPTPKKKLLAAAELRASNWRFHKALGTWFARLEPPKVINEAERYEQGSVIYFDHNMQVNEADSSTNGWCQRSRSDFTSRYDDFI